MVTVPPSTVAAVGAAASEEALLSPAEGVAADEAEEPPPQPANKPADIAHATLSAATFLKVFFFMVIYYNIFVGSLTASSRVAIQLVA